MPDRKSLATLIVGIAAGSGGTIAWSANAPPAARAYVVAEMTVKDLPGYRAYGDRAAPIIQKYGGNFLVRGGQTVQIEGAAPARIVIIGFPSLEQAKRFEYSPEYTAIAPMRQKAADSRLFLIEGTVTPP